MEWTVLTAAIAVFCFAAMAFFASAVTSPDGIYTKNMKKAQSTIESLHD